MPLKPPPRDSNGEATPHDHDEIASDHGVVRRVAYQQTVLDAQGKRRLSSLAFEPSTDICKGLSIDLEQSITAAGLDPKAFVTTPKYLGSVRFEAGAIRALGLKVGFDPLPDNEHHGEVWGATGRSAKKQLLKLSVWFVPLPDVYIP